MKKNQHLSDSIFMTLRSAHDLYASFKKGMKILFLMVIVAFASSCASNGIKGVAEPPSVAVEGVKISKMSIMGGEAIVSLNVNNPNNFPLPLNGFNYGLKLNGIEVASGKEKGNLSIASKGSRVLHIPVELSLIELIRFSPQLLTKQGLTYELAGAAQFPLIDIPFRRTGGVIR